MTGKFSPVGLLGMVWGGGKGIKIEDPPYPEGAKATALTERVCPPPSQPPSATPHTSSPAWHLWTPSLTTSVPSQKSHYNTAVTILPAPSPAGRPSGPLKWQEAVKPVEQDGLMRALGLPGLLPLIPSQQPASRVGSVQAVMQEGREAVDLTSPSLCQLLWLRAARLSSRTLPAVCPRGQGEKRVSGLKELSQGAQVMRGIHGLNLSTLSMPLGWVPAASVHLSTYQDAEAQTHPRPEESESVF